MGGSCKHGRNGPKIVNGKSRRIAGKTMNEMGRRCRSALQVLRMRGWRKLRWEWGRMEASFELGHDPEGAVAPCKGGGTRNSGCVVGRTDLS